MKLRTDGSIGGFTLGEVMVSLAMTSLLMAAALSASIALQKSMWASDKFFSTHMQQIRIIDYLSRDSKRAYSVTTSLDRATVTCAVPNYVVQAGDSELAAGVEAEGARRTPIITVTVGGPQVDYGRRVTDGVTTKNSTTLLSVSAGFTDKDVGSAIWGAGIPSGTTITARTSAASVTLSKAAKVTAASATITWTRSSSVVYSLNSDTIERREDGAVTTVASSTDQLVPDTLDVELANTEYTASTVTFLPVFNFNPHASQQGQAQQIKRKGTTVFATSYLRNKRRN